MENTTTNSDVIEVLTELTVSDIKTIEQIVDTCLQLNLFAEPSKQTVEEIQTKVKTLLSKLESQ